MRVSVIVLESFIAEQLRSRYPRQSAEILCIPHGFDESESLPLPGPRGDPRVLRILFVGQATPPKGFVEFVRLADLARSRGNGRMEFRAAGAVRRDTRAIDQSALARRAGEDPLPRSELLLELSATDFVFTWQSEHYDLTPSGILLDCIGLGVPMVGRRSRAIAALEARYGACGLFADDLESLLHGLSAMDDPEQRQRQLETWRANLRRARADRRAEALGVIAARELES
jgi:hypothetical protein